MISQNELLQIAGDGVSVDTAKLDLARQGAHNFMISYLSATYKMPITANCPALKDCEADIVRYYLYDDNPTEVVVLRYEHWKTWLESVSRGKVQLCDVDGVPLEKLSSPRGSDGFFTVTGAAKVFNEDLAAKYDITKQC